DSASVLHVGGLQGEDTGGVVGGAALHQRDGASQRSGGERAARVGVARRGCVHQRPGVASIGGRIEVGVARDGGNVHQICGHASAQHLHAGSHDVGVGGGSDGDHRRRRGGRRDAVEGGVVVAIAAAVVAGGHYHHDGFSRGLESRGQRIALCVGGGAARRARIQRSSERPPGGGHVDHVHTVFH